MMIRVLALLLILPVAAQAQALSLTDISRYLNSIRAAKADFVQANPDKTLAQGVLFLKKPGRIRYEYTVPDDNLVITDGTYLAIFDKKSNRGAQLFDLKRTPLELLLKDQIDLQKAGAIRDIDSDGVQTRITARDPDNPKAGTITMVFTANPTELRQWVIRDPVGRKTTVILNNLEVSRTLPDRLFDIGQANQAAR